MGIAKRALAIKPSPTLAMAARAKAMKAQGIDVVDFGVGEPDFDTPQHIKDAAKKAIDNGFTKYTPSSGTDELREAVVRKFKTDNGLEYDKTQVLISCGAKQSLYNIAEALFDPGDEIIIPAPYWVSYPDQVVLNDAKPVIVETTEAEKFTLSARKLESAVTKKTKAIILNSPSNPTGLAYDKKTLEEIAAVAMRHKLYVISDEIYEKLIYDGFTHTSIASLGKEIKDLTIVVNGVSKSHAMTGWRIGFAAGPKDVITAMANIQSQSTSNPASISQKAALEALTGSQDFLKVMNAEFDKRRKYMVERLNSIPGVSCLMPVGAFYAFPRVSAHFGTRSAGGNVIKNSSDFANVLLDEARVALVSGDSFGADAHIRLSYATSMENVRKGLDRIEGMVKALK
ncbi:MAG: aspartate aminotransferase [Nitrospirae bacterium GWC2_57_13]|nr:MAG: aspartate aminotransferase [Nitrospirae bacterium GWC2_57_13]OGW44356.1 MAG: aspartate aminotransferase [Nitrospirae bacterium GWD2_57_8]HAS54256.1 aspartate aminotransferase [Nitrospiraceae bacterium]